MYQQAPQESIYNLIPKECSEKEKTVRYADTANILFILLATKRRVVHERARPKSIFCIFKATRHVHSAFGGRIWGP